MSTCTSSMTIFRKGRGICLTTRITSSVFVWMEGGKRPLRLLDLLFKKRAAGDTTSGCDASGGCSDDQPFLFDIQSVRNRA